MCLYLFFIICACFQIQSSKLRKESQKFSCYLYLFESLKHLLPLREVSEEKLESAGHEGRVVVHAQVKKNPEESFAPGPIQIKDCTVLAKKLSIHSLNAFWGIDENRGD